MKKLGKPSKAELKKWDKILKDSGFDDIEYRMPDGTVSDLLKRPSTTHGMQIADKYDTTLEKYSRAGQLLHSGRIPVEDVPFWELYCEGNSIRKIGDILGTGYNPARRSINRTLILLNTYINECVIEEAAEPSEWQYAEDLNPWGTYDDEIDDLAYDEEYSELKF